MSRTMSSAHTVERLREVKMGARDEVGQWHP